MKRVCGFTISRISHALLRRIAVLRTYVVHAAYCYRPSSAVCLSVHQSVTLVSPAKTTEAIEMLFPLRTQVGPRNHVLHGGTDPPAEVAILRGKWANRCTV